jgi:MFS family permease
MFLTGGVLGIIGVYTLARTPEPRSVLVNEHMVRLFSRPLKDKNFRNLLIFNALWAFSLNLATPFLAVYMMKTLELPLSYIIALGILNQLTSIAFLRVWGGYADRYSNKNIIGICAPIYVTCILAWAFTGMTSITFTLMLLVLINIFSGLSTAGINLAMANIGIKLAPKEESIVYLSAKNMIIAACSALAPLAGGLMADFFANHQLVWNFQWTGAEGVSMIRQIDLHGWNFFSVIGGTLAMLSLRLLGNVKEKGEVQKNRVVIYMRANIRSKWRENRLLGKRVAAHFAVWK